MGIKSIGSLPRIYTCSDDVNMVDYIDIDYKILNLINLPTVIPNSNVDVNMYVSDITKKTARINFSQKFVGKVYYTVLGYN